MRRIWERVAAWWRRGPIWGDRGPWDYTTRRTVTVTLGPEPKRPATSPPVRSDIYSTRARTVCRKFGHTLRRGFCLVCEELVGDVTVEDLKPKEPVE